MQHLFPLDHDPGLNPSSDQKWTLECSRFTNHWFIREMQTIFLSHCKVTTSLIMGKKEL